MARTLVKTTTAGWFINAEDPDGKRVRKQDGDNVISLEQFQANKDGDAPTQERTPTQEAAAKGAEGAHKAKAARKAAEKGPEVTLDSGKTTTDKTVVIECDSREDDKYSVGPDGRVIRKAGKQKACGKKRTIKVQDAFQVTMCTDHAERHKLNKRKAKRAAIKLAAAA